MSLLTAKRGEPILKKTVKLIDFNNKVELYVPCVLRMRYSSMVEYSYCKNDCDHYVAGSERECFHDLGNVTFDCKFKNNERKEHVYTYVFHSIKNNCVKPGVSNSPDDKGVGKRLRDARTHIKDYEPIHVYYGGFARSFEHFLHYTYFKKSKAKKANEVYDENHLDTLLLLRTLELSYPEHTSTWIKSRLGITQETIDLQKKIDLIPKDEVKKVIGAWVTHLYNLSLSGEFSDKVWKQGQKQIQIWENLLA